MAKKTSGLFTGLNRTVGSRPVRGIGAGLLFRQDGLGAYQAFRTIARAVGERIVASRFELYELGANLSARERLARLREPECRNQTDDNCNGGFDG